MDFLIFINTIIENIRPWIINHGINILFIIFIALIFTHKFNRVIIAKIIRLTVIDKNHSEKETKQRQDTLIKIYSTFFIILVWFIALSMILQEIGINIGALIAAAGILGIAIGFGAQDLVKDFLSGFFIIKENQYRIGDVVTIAGAEGQVEDISLRMTTLRDLDGTAHHIPHGEITIVSNRSKYYAQVNLNIGVSYNSDLEKVISTINEVGQKLSKDPLWENHIVSPLRFLRVESFADSAIIIKVLGKTKPIHQWAVAGEFRKRIKIAFDKEGIEIPLPQMVIHQKNN